MLYTEFGKTQLEIDTSCAYCEKVLPAKSDICVQKTDPIQDSLREEIIEEEFTICCDTCCSRLERLLHQYHISINDIDFLEPLEPRKQETVRKDM